MLTSTGDNSKTILTLAASSGSKDTVEATLAALSSEKVRYRFLTVHSDKRVISLLSQFSKMRRYNSCSL